MKKLALSLASLFAFAFVRSAAADEPPMPPPDGDAAPPASASAPPPVATTPTPPATPPPPPPVATTDPPPIVRVNVDVNVGIAHFTRSQGSPSSETGFTLGGDLRFFPAPSHGVFLGAAAGGALWGPSVFAVDGGYSFRVGEMGHVRGITGDVTASIGPSIASVRNSSGESHYAVFGGRASLSAHLYIWNFALGIDASYRGGAALDAPNGWCSMYTATGTLGFEIDSGERPRK